MVRDIDLPRPGAQPTAPALHAGFGRKGSGSAPKAAAIQPVEPLPSALASDWTEQSQAHGAVVRDAGTALLATLACLILLVIGTLVHSNPLIGFVGVTALAWIAAEMCRGRAMRISETVLALWWIIGISGTYFFAVSTAFLPIDFDFAALDPKAIPPIIVFCCSGSMILASALHWWRFRIPVLIAAVFFAVGSTVGSIGLMIDPDWRIPLAATMQMLLGAIAIVAGIWADISDVYRRTERARAAFWLHLVGAFFMHEGVTTLSQLSPRSDIELIAAASLTVLLLGTGLITDRKIYLLIGLRSLALLLLLLVPPPAPVALILTVSAGLIGFLFWQQLRSFILSGLPLAWRAQLPRLASERAARAAAPPDLSPRPA